MLGTETCGDQSKDDGVISSCLECFLSDGELYQFQYGVTPAVFLAKARGGTCTLARADPPEDVIHRAEYLFQNGFGGYNIFKNNCEDFAIYYKTGLLIFTTVSVGRSASATAMGCGIYCISRLVSDIGVRRDVMKIPVERLVCHPGLNEPEAESLVSHSVLDEPEAETRTPKEK
ncbi:hypothetical protein SASPL_154711 [Salvia splendens]|uniref:LRAT domain-containing protein n=1 Tax=Salvia splendens TaxID=180675 RepID=A0A8X8W0F4_SALSN|nr:hypothetical protein SASPL_154711 [Salvia splendens]